MEETICGFAVGSTTEVNLDVVRTNFVVQSAYTSTIEWSLLKWNGRDCDGSMHDAIGFYCCHVTTFWNLTGTANFQAAEITVWTRQTLSPMAWEWVWTRGSCWAVSPTAWERGYLIPRLLCRGGEKSLVYTVCAHSALLGILRICVYYTVSLFCPSSITKDGGAVTRVQQSLCCKDTAEFLHLQAKSHWKPLGDINCKLHRQGTCHI